MPTNKDQFKRIREIDKLLADTSQNYTTEKISKHLEGKGIHVNIKTIQNDINAIEREHGKTIIRNRDWNGRLSRGLVRYDDDTEPIFFELISNDEEEILKGALSCLGQFEGLENFQWMEKFRKKLDIKENVVKTPYIVFDKGQGLMKYKKGKKGLEEEVPKNLLGNLFTAIARKKVIRFRYTPVYRTSSKDVTVYPYQLRQHNCRWFLIATPYEDPYKPVIYNYPLDRMDGTFEYVENLDYIELATDLEERFSEILGVTLLEDKACEEIVFAVDKPELPYVQTKPIHNSQDELLESAQKEYRKMFPKLKDHTFFSITCRENPELTKAFMSFYPSIIVISPESLRAEMMEKAKDGMEAYSNICESILPEPDEVE